MIVPPPEIKSLILKTVGFVLKNGRDFEEKIRTKEKGVIRFSFLSSNDPYYSYYERSLCDSVFLANELKNQNAAFSHNFHENDEAQENGQLVLGFVYSFTKKPPLLDLSIIRLAARYISVNNTSFMLSLYNREGINPQFEFLKPVHPYNYILKYYIETYGYIKSYSCCEHQFSDRFALLDSILPNIKTRKKSFKTDESDKSTGADSEWSDWNEFSIIGSFVHVNYSRWAPVETFTELISKPVKYRLNRWIE